MRLNDRAHQRQVINVGGTAHAYGASKGRVGQVFVAGNADGKSGRFVDDDPYRFIGQTTSRRGRADFVELARAIVAVNGLKNTVFASAPDARICGNEHVGRRELTLVANAFYQGVASALDEFTIPSLTLNSSYKAYQYRNVWRSRRLPLHQGHAQQGNGGKGQSGCRAIALNRLGAWLLLICPVIKARRQVKFACPK